MASCRFLTLTFVSAACLAVPAPRGFGDTIFNLRAASIEAIDEVSSFTLTLNGISATLTAYAGGVTNPATVLNRTDSGFGVNAVGSGDVTDQIDAINGTEAVTIVFNKDVLFGQLQLSLYSTAGQSPPGDQAKLVLPGLTDLTVATSSANDVYNYSEKNFVAAGQTVTLSHVQGNGFSFDNFTVSEVTPRPSVAWGSVLLLVVFAGIRKIVNVKRARVA
jgi:hypothetical protein